MGQGRGVRARAAAVFDILQQANPHPTTELTYTNAYQLLVAVVLSAQATDIGVNKATADLFAQVATPAQMLALGEEGLLSHIRSIGLYKTKGKNILELSRQLQAHHHGQVPRSREALQALPGVGRKTANVVLNTLYGEATLAVDTHVFRVSHRLGLVPPSASTPEKVETHLVKTIPAKYLVHAHHWLILHGRYTCKARSPACLRCPVEKMCPSSNIK